MLVEDPRRPTRVPGSRGSVGTGVLMTIRSSSLLAAFFCLLPAALPAHALVTFGPPATLNSTAATDSDADLDDDGDHDVSIASNGVNWVAVWASDNSLGNTIGGDPDILVSRSSDDG